MIKNIIRKILKEIDFITFEKPENIKEWSDNKGYYFQFIINNYNYIVSFKYINQILNNIHIKEERARNAINGSENKYIVSFGILDESGNYFDNVETKNNNTFYVLKNVFWVIKNFISEKDIDVIGFSSLGTREKIYNDAIKELSKYYHFHSFPSEPFKFLIKLDLYNKYA